MRCFGKKVHTHHCKVVLLDEQELIQEIQDTTPGQEVLDTVFRHLNLLETAYFGLRYLDASSQTHWLDPGKKVAKQLKGTDPFTLYFGVKFYAADPCKLLEEITRYQFFLQVKQDILQGRLPVSFDLAAELGSYVVQSELGDYDQRRHSAGYVSEFRFLANQTVELESRIAELHKGLVGQIPAVAELNYLEKVKWLDMYGVDLHPVLGEDNVEYFLGLTPSGIIVLRNKTKVGNYYWPRITKVYFKGRYFMLRVCDKNSEENTYGFETPSKQACKHLWKCCVEHHAFFRLVQVSPPHAASSDAPSAGGGSVFSIGSRFRYSGRTEKQAQADAQMRLRSPPQFTRTPSRRYQRRIVEGAQDMPIVEENSNNENIPPQEMKNVSIPQPVHTVTSMYRSTSIPSVLPRSDSPRSIRSAPWSAATNTANTTAGSGMSMTRGLYSGASPRSVRSAPHHPPNTQLLSRLTRRSSSVESQSSVDSRSCKRHHHHHRSRRGSDNDSEVSKSSCRSHSHRRHRSHHKRDSGSENDQQHRHRHRSYRHRHGSNYELVDSEAQWKEVQRKQAEGQSGIQQATVVRDLGNRRSGYMNSGMETESELSYHHKRKHKKHRSRSRSPDTKARLPDELKKHLEFDLIETEGMSADQLKEIPYKAVETDTKPPKIKYSPNSKRRQRSPRRSKSSTLDERCQPPNSGDSPPPPYSPPQQGGLGPGPPNGNIGNSQETTTTSPLSPAGDGNGNLASTNPAISGSLADLLKSSNPSTTNHSPAGSVRSNHLPRAGASGSSSIPPSGHSSHRQAALNYSANKLTNSIYTPGITFSSALYGNAGKLLGNNNIPNGHASSISMSSGSSTKYHEGAYHEHSDSGLGADSQDYIYNGRNNETSRYLQASRISAAFTKPVSTSKTYPIPSPLATMRSGHSGNMAFKSSQPSNHHSTPPHKQLDRHGTMASNRSLGNHTNPIDDLKRSHPGLGGWLSPENSSSSPRHTTYSPGSYPSSNSQRSQSSLTNQSQHYARRPQLPLPTAKATNQSLVPPPSPSSTNYHESWDDRKHQQSVGGAVGGGIGGIGGGDTPALGPRVPSRLAGSMRSVRSGPAGADGGWRAPLKDSNKTNTGDHKEDPRNAQGRHQGEGQILRRARSSSLELILTPIIQSTYQ